MYVPASAQKSRRTFRYIRHAINYVIHLGSISSQMARAYLSAKRSDYNFSDLETARYATRSSRLSCYYEDPDYVIHVITSFAACIAM